MSLCRDHPSPALRTVRAPFDAHGSPFTSFLRCSLGGERTCMKLMMTGATEDECFSVAGCHHALPKRFSFCYIFQFSHMMHLKWPFRRFTVLASLPVESFGDFREAQRPEVPVKLDIELWVVRCWFSEVFESKDTDGAGLLLSFDDELETLLRLVLFDQLVQRLFHPSCQGVLVCQSPKLSIVGKNDFSIGEVHPLWLVGRLPSGIVSIPSLRTELLHFVLGDMKLDLFREGFYPGVAGATLELDNSIC